MTVYDLRRVKLGSGLTGINLGGGIHQIASASPRLGYTQFTAAVTVSATTAATANTIVTAPAITFDGTTVIQVEFYAPYAQAAGGSAYIMLLLFDGSTQIGRLGLIQNDAGNLLIFTPSIRSPEITPSAGSHTYSVRAFRNAANWTVGAGSGGADPNYFPGYIRVVKAV